MSPHSLHCNCKKKKTLQIGNVAFSFPFLSQTVKKLETSFWLYAFRRNEHLRGPSPGVIAALTFQNSAINTKLSALLLLIQRFQLNSCNPLDNVFGASLSMGPGKPEKEKGWCRWGSSLRMCPKASAQIHPPRGCGVGMLPQQLHGVCRKFRGNCSKWKCKIYSSQVGCQWQGTDRKGNQVLGGTELFAWEVTWCNSSCPRNQAKPKANNPILPFSICRKNWRLVSCMIWRGLFSCSSKPGWE